MEKLLLRVPEAAALVSISRSKGYELVANGEWPVIRIGRSVRIPMDELRAWLDRQKQEQWGPVRPVPDDRDPRPAQGPPEPWPQRRK